MISCVVQARERQADVSTATLSSEPRTAPVSMVLQGVDNLHKAQPLQDLRLHCVVSEVVQQGLQISFQGLVPVHRQGATMHGSTVCNDHLSS